jgi:hypothetical protein
VEVLTALHTAYNILAVFDAPVIHVLTTDQFDNLTTFVDRVEVAPLFTRHAAPPKLNGLR